MSGEVLLECIRLHEEFHNNLMNFVPSRLAPSYIFKAGQEMIKDINRVMKNAGMSEEDIAEMLDVLPKIHAFYCNLEHNR